MFYNEPNLMASTRVPNLPPDVMSMGLQTEYEQTQCILADGGDRFGVSVLSFDRYEELLWMGNQGGHVTSYYTGALQKYTSFQVFSEGEEVRQILPIDGGVLALGSNCLRYQLRRGIPVFTHTSPNLMDMQCMLLAGGASSSRLLIGGHHNKLVDFNLDVCKEAQIVNVGEAGCVMLRPHTRYVCAGNPLGRIDLHDPHTLKVEHSLETHSGSLSDFDVQGNLLVTCGFSNRHGGAMTVDRFLMVYDLRMMRAVTPIRTVLDPLYLRFLPATTSRVAVVSAMGQAQLVDVVAYGETRMCLMQMEAPAMCLCFDVSATNQAVALGDNAGSIHLFTSTDDEPQFNSYSRMTEHSDEMIAFPAFAIDDYSTSLSAVPMPLMALAAEEEGRPLLSDWPSHLTRKCHRQCPPIDPEILRTMKMTGSIGYAQNPHTHRRNQVVYDLGEKRRGRDKLKLIAGGLRHGSPKLQMRGVDARNIGGGSGIGQSSFRVGGGGMATGDGGGGGGEGGIGGGGKTNSFIAIPKRYRRLDMKYGKLGQDECQFELFNRTPFSGLEAALPNAYCNAMIQVLYFIEPLRAALLSHLCSKEFCLSCELGFLFYMMRTASNGQPCQPANFLRAFRTIPEAAALGLVYTEHSVTEQRHKAELGALIQSWHRFIIHQLHVELAECSRKRHQVLMRMQQEQQRRVFHYRDVDFPSIDTCERSLRRTTLAENSASGQHSQQRDHTSDTSEITQLWGIDQIQEHICLKCKHDVKKSSVLLVCNLVYPKVSSTSRTGTTTRNPHQNDAEDQQQQQQQQDLNATPLSQNITQEWTFCDILKHSLCTQQVTPAWCDTCKRFAPTRQLKRAHLLPPLLAINTCLDKAENRHFWQLQMDRMVAKNTTPPTAMKPPDYSGATTPVAKPCRYGTYCSRPGCRFRHSPPPLATAPAAVDSPSPTRPTTATTNPYCTNNWLPHHITMTLTRRTTTVDGQGGDDEDLIIKEQTTSAAATTTTMTTDQDLFSSRQYDLTAVVCYINDPVVVEKRNLVALIRVPPTYMNGKTPNNNSNNNISDEEDTNDDVPEGATRWYLFNDFGITAVGSQEATWFNLEWKVPMVLYYSTRAVSRVRSPIVTPVSKEVFLMEAGRCTLPAAVSTFTPLHEHEFPKPGDLCAMDAEFVTLNQEEAELRSDGKMSMVKPSQMSVARITCIRGWGQLEGVPFIDDYISTQEQVVDYLTKFSGIKPGDLDANFSSKHLTTLKSTYTKLRYLQDLGVIFVGHGLKNDFRVINLVVASDQIVDTVQLFHLPHHRMVSLRFLAWHFLGVRIQSETHDSAEDARAALHLYRKYVQLEGEHRMREALTTLYERGTVLNWKVPDE